MKRITPQIKKIADAHIEARITRKWDNPICKTAQDVFKFTLDGKTIEPLMDEIEIRNCSITSIVMAKQLSHPSLAYKKGVYQGFSNLLNTTK